jgi:hypothetical protein
VLGSMIWNQKNRLCGVSPGLMLTLPSHPLGVQ